MQLEALSNETIAPLSEFVFIPDVEKDVPFEQKDPKLQLFLFSNQLTRVPGAIFDLNHLTVLSLRGNQLTELPPSILKLKNLSELNLSQNRLRYLPIELLELIYEHHCKLKTLHLHPNPWVQPKPMESGPHHGLLRLALKPPLMDPSTSGNRWLRANFDVEDLNDDVKTLYAFFRARTPLELQNSTEARASDFRIGHNETSLPTEDWQSEPQWPEHLPRPLSKKVPSLMELSLKTCLQTSYAPQLSELLDPDVHRASIKALQQAQDLQETGGMTCTVCGEDIINPAAQWIEWWQIYECEFDHTDQNVAVEGEPPLFLTSSLFRARSASRSIRRSATGLPQIDDEQLIPFIRRACSWHCVLDRWRGLGNSTDTWPVQSG